jgi:hypothetical protein
MKSATDGDAIDDVGMKCITWFKDADALIKSMIANPKDAYWRNQ